MDQDCPWHCQKYSVHFPISISSSAVYSSFRSRGAYKLSDPPSAFGHYQLQAEDDAAHAGLSLWAQQYWDVDHLEWMIPFPTSFHHHPVTTLNPPLPWDGSLSPHAGGHPTIDFIAFFKQGSWAMWAQLLSCFSFHLIISSLSERLPQEQMQLIGVLLTWFTLWLSILFKCSLKMAQSWSQIFWWMHQQSWMKTQSLQIHLVTLLGSYGHLLIRCGVISCEHEW